MDDNGGGHLHCFDLFDDVERDKEGKLKYVSPVLGPLESRYNIAQGHLDYAGLLHRATLHRGDSSTNIRRVFAEHKLVADFAFIDGDHRIKGAMKDWLAVEEVLSPTALVTAHDTLPSSGWLGPRFLLDGLGKHARDQVQWVNIAAFDKTGLGIIQKLTSEPARRFKPSIPQTIAEYIFHKRWWG